ncbi:MAG: hypothetical protein JL50_20145 [Peptococcaceae bacterium BICA1-7]|nr:MAG: hypothetical protein JL50_20145 [Peptococcaceae bacterium BICA1-7]HBV98393.1 hypothetical protein [Desulfotomaculum sp.]
MRFRKILSVKLTSLLLIMVFFLCGSFSSVYGNSNVNLSNFIISQGILSPSFSPSITSYTSTVANSVYDFKITPTVEDSVYANVYVNGLLATSGMPFGPLSLNNGDNSISTVVYAQDGTTKNYNLNIFRDPVVRTPNAVNSAITKVTKGPKGSIRVTIEVTVRDAANNGIVGLGPHDFTGNYSWYIQNGSARNYRCFDEGPFQPLYYPFSDFMEIGNGVYTVNFTGSEDAQLFFDFSVTISGITTETTTVITPDAIATSGQPSAANSIISDVLKGPAGSKRATLEITVKDSSNTPVQGLTAADFRGNFSWYTQNGTVRNYRRFDEGPFQPQYYPFSDFMEIGNGVYRVNFTGIEDAQYYYDFSVTIKGVTTPSRTVITADAITSTGEPSANSIISKVIRGPAGSKKATIELSVNDVANTPVTGLVAADFRGNYSWYVQNGSASNSRRFDEGPFQALYYPFSDFRELGNGLYKVDFTGSEDSQRIFDFSVTIRGITTASTTVKTANQKIELEPFAENPVIPIDNKDTTIIIPDSVINPTINVYTNQIANNTSQAILPYLEIFRDSNSLGGEVKAEIPEETVISTVYSSWDGNLDLPTVQSNNSVNISSENGAISSSTAVVQIGGSCEFTLNKAARLLLPGQAGKEAGFFDGNTFKKITTILSEDSQISGDSLPSGGEGRIDVGQDLIIWTKHFTRFVAYSQNHAPSSNANLSELSISSGLLSPAFSEDITSYTASVGNDNSSIIVTPIAIDQNAIVKINGNVVAVGQSSGPINLDVGDNTITIVVTAQDGITSRTYIINVKRAVATTIDVNNPIVVVGNDPVSINVSDGVTNAKVQVTPVNEGANKVSTVPLIETRVPTSLGNIDIAIPAGTKITGPSNWDGTINLPKVEATSSVSVNGTVNAVIEVGLPGQILTFDKAVRLLIPGQAGKSVGYKRGNNPVTEITRTISADKQVIADTEIPAEGDGKVPIGSDMAVWTKHFTQFVAYTPVSGGGGGGSSAVLEGTRVGAGGGKVTLKDVTIDIPPGALNMNTLINVNKVSNLTLPIPERSKLVSDIVEITKNQPGKFEKLVTITMIFDKSKVDGERQTISLHWFDESAKKWIKTLNVKVDFTEGKVSGDIDHFAKFSVMTTDKIDTIITFEDTSGHWAAESIEKMVESGIIKGYGDGSFRPDSDITRAEFIQVLVKAFQLSPIQGEVYSDTVSHWAREAVSTARSNGIISGYSSDSFGPDDQVTKEQAAVMIVKAGKFTSSTFEDPSLRDIADISGWAKESVASAFNNRIITGYPDGTFRPQGKATRAEAVTMIMKAVKKNK